MNIPGAFSQRDPRWGDQLLGYNTSMPYTIYNYGCLITSLSNMLWYMGHQIDPGALNNHLKAVQGFAPGGGLLNWAVVPSLSADITPQGTTPSWVDTDQYVQVEGHFAVVQVTKPGFPMHFVLATQAGQIVDPWDGLAKALPAGYSFVTAHLYGDKTPDFVTNPVPVTPQVVTAPDPEKIPMNTQQFNDAYHIVLNRAPERGPDGRTAIAFIYDAAPELAQQRTEVAAQIADLKNQLAAAQGTIEVLHKAQTTDWQHTFRDDRRERIVQRDGYALNIETGEQIPVQKGLIIPQAGTFIYQNTSFSRTEKSAEAELWIGVPEALLQEDGQVPEADTSFMDLKEDGELDKTMEAHAAMAKLAGLFYGIKNWFTTKLKRSV